MILEIKSNLGYFSPLFADSLFCAPIPGPSVSLVKQIKIFPKKASLFAAGDMAANIYRLVEGEVRLILNDETSEIQISRLVEPNEVLGLVEAIMDLPYKIDARAITSCTCETIGREDLIKFLHNEPGVGFRLTQLMGSSLHNSYQLFLSQ
jgi:CRP-like cAMP-binding protein